MVEDALDAGGCISSHNIHGLACDYLSFVRNISEDAFLPTKSIKHGRFTPPTATRRLRLKVHVTTCFGSKSTNICQSPAFLFNAPSPSKRELDSELVTSASY